MPTSAIGREAGFTLVELMVVMAIVGLAVAGVTLALPNDHDRLRHEAEALAARLVAARDLAVIGNGEVRVRIAEAGYRFERRARSGWQPANGRALAPRTLPAGVTLAADSGGAPTLAFDATGLAAPARLVLRRGEAQAEITVDAAGAVHVAP